MCKDFGEFATANELGEKDLILTNEYIYEPYMAKYNLKCGVCFQEKFGGGEPTDVMVEEIAKSVGISKYTRIVAVGGGTILDIAKLLSLQDFEAVDELFDASELVKVRKLCLIPTTCGTGSEVTNASVVNRTRMGTKMGLLREALFADEAVLIPEFLGSLPYKVFATSSIDALVHAIESYLNPVNNGIIEMFAVDAINTITAVYKVMVKDGLDKRFDYSAEMLKASCFAGVAFSNNSCAAVHALSYALGGKYHVAHGESNYQFLVEVLKAYKKKAPDGKMAALEEVLAKALDCKAEESIDKLEELLSGILVNKKMREYGAVEQDVEDFADSTVNTQQRLLKGNYVALTRDEIRDIYKARF